MIYAVIIMGYIICLGIGIFLFRGKKEVPHNSVPPQLTYDELFHILNQNIQRQITIRHQDYTFRHVKAFKRFQDELDSLVYNVTESLSLSFLNDFGYYHPRKYVLRYITKACREYLQEYLRNNKVTTK